MTKITRAIFIVTVLLILAFSLSAQVRDTVKPAEAARENEAKQVLNMFVKADAAVIKYIFWDDFYFNDEDITYFYYESLEYGDDEVFTKEIVKEISDLLHYEGDAKDIFSNWSFEHSAEGMFSNCNNKKKAVDFWFYTPANDHIYLREINIKNRK